MMITRGASLLSRAAAIFAIFSILTACGGGGGGGDGGGFYNPGNGGEDQLQLELRDQDGNKTTTVVTSAQLRVAVKRGGDNVVVSVSTDIGEVAPPSGTALTDGNGVAYFTILAGDARGAGTITASAQLEDGTAITGTLAFQVGANGLRIGRFDENGQFIENEIDIQPAGTLSQRGNAQLSVVVLDSNGELVTTVERVSFASGCLNVGQATINPANPVSTVNGRASTTYTAAGCTGLDDIQASAPGASSPALGTLNVAAAESNAILFVSAEPTLIVLRGTGGLNRDETSNVTFRVVDRSGNPLPGVAVDLSLSTDVGGLSLSNTTGLSNADGEVSTTVAAGDVATSVRVIATINFNGEEILTSSDQITVTTGLPDANSITLGVFPSFMVPRGMVTNGLSRELVVHMADKFNNPVVDGTPAVFTTEYGAIIGSCVTTNGECSVDWRTQEPRFPTLTGTQFIRETTGPGYDCPASASSPGHNGSSGPCPNDLGYTRGGRSTVLVHVIGEESFIDRNGNGIMDEAEKDLFDNLPEAFIDHNEDGVYTPDLPECMANPMGSARCIAGMEEIFVDFNNNNQYDRNDEPALYNGLLCPPEGDGVWCSRKLLHVFKNIVVTMNDPRWDILVARGTNVVPPNGTITFK